MRQVCRQSPFESLPLTIEWSGRLFVTGSCMKATKTILPDQGPFPQNPQTGKERKKKQKRKKGCCYYRYTISSSPLDTIRTASCPTPPHRSRRAVFPHRALQKDSLPQKALPPSSLFPSVRLAWFVRPFVSGPGFLCGLRLSVRPFPCERLSRSLSTTSGSDSLQTFGSLPFGSGSPTCLPLPWPSLVCLGSGLLPFPGFPFCGAISVCLAAVFRLTSAKSGV